MCSEENVTSTPLASSLRLPLQIGDVVQRDGASVGGADAADVAGAQQAGDAGQAHAGAVQVQVSEMHVFEELNT